MAVDMYLEIPEIKGESQKRAMKEQMDIVSFSDGVRAAHQLRHPGQGRRQRQGRIPGHPHRQICRQGFEPCLWKACANHQHFDKATIHFVKHGEKPMEYWTVVLEDVAIASVQTTGQLERRQSDRIRHSWLRQDHEDLHRAEGGWRAWLEGRGTSTASGEDA